jgi:hypothetical protein
MHLVSCNFQFLVHTIFPPFLRSFSPFFPASGYGGTVISSLLKSELNPKFKSNFAALAYGPKFHVLLSQSYAPVGPKLRHL